MAQKNIKKSFFILASILLSVASFAGSMFAGNKVNNTAYADVVSPTPTPSNEPCPGGGDCDTCVGDNDKNNMTSK